MFAKFRTTLFFTIVSFLLATCSAPLSQAPELERPIIKVQISPLATHLLDELNSCAEKQGTIKLSVHTIPAHKMNPADYDLTIHLGINKTSDQFVSVLGYEEIILITHPDNPLVRISEEDIKQVFIGEFASWQEIQGASTVTNFDHPVSVFSYSPNDELHQWLIQDLLQIEKGQLRVQFVGSQEKIIEQVNNTPGAIGYILKSQADNQVNTVSLDPKDDLNLTIPVLSITNEDPQNELFSLLLCLQE